MGLDMYLYRKTYVKNWDFMRPEERHEITVKKGGVTRKDIKPERICYIVEQVAYWRKANAIHNWFVEKCQGGVDECQETYVDREKIKELVSLCKQVLESVETVPGKILTKTVYTAESVEQHFKDGNVVAQKTIAESLLPSKSGFFFGSTEYDEYYLQDLKETVEMLEPLLNDEHGDFIYRASW